MDPNQLNALITETLKMMGGRAYSPAAVELLMLTAAQETHCGRYIRQVPDGPALGIFQMEMATHDDIWDNFLEYNDALKYRVYDFWLSHLSDEMNLKGNLLYQIAMARAHYMRDKQLIPPHDDVVGLATYYKRVWNTHLGKATVEQAIENYKKYAFRKEIKDA